MKNLILLTCILVGLNAFAENSRKPSGLYRAVSELCSGGSVYMFDEQVMTSSSTDVELTMDFLSDSLVELSQYIAAGTPLNDGDLPITGSFIVEYSLNNNELIYGKIIEWKYPNEKRYEGYRNNMQSLFDNEQLVKKISVGRSELTLSFPGFNGHGRCTPPEYIINIYDKVN